MKKLSIMLLTSFLLLGSNGMVQGAAHEDPPQPISHEDPPQPISHEDPPQPISHEDPPQP